MEVILCHEVMEQALPVETALEQAEAKVREKEPEEGEIRVISPAQDPEACAYALHAERLLLIRQGRPAVK